MTSTLAKARAGGRWSVAGGNGGAGARVGAVARGHRALAAGFAGASVVAGRRSPVARNRGTGAPLRAVPTGHRAPATLFFFLALALLALPLFANDLSVDKQSVQLDDTVTIVVSLEDAYAEVDGVNLPVQNLELLGPPSVSSQFSWINGATTRRKVFRFVARPKAAGPALVGPLVVAGANGQRETLPPVAVQVLPDATSGSNDPLTIFRGLVARHGDPIFVVAELDKPSAYVGEEVVVTWRIYNAATVREWQLIDLPKLEDFWSEELDVRGEPQQQVILDNSIVQQVAVRRVALFPLRSGTLHIAPIAVEALVLRRVDSPFGFFEASSEDITRRSVPLTVEVKPLPPGPPVDAIGDVTLTCSKPVQQNGGPVAMTVTLHGRANLRAAVPPHWERPLDGSVQIGERPMSVERTHEFAAMTRTWNYLMFPSRAGRFEVPPLVATTFTSAGSRQTLRCEAATLDVVAAAPPVEPPPSTPAAARVRTLRPYLPWIGGALVAFIVVMLAIPRLRRAAALRRRVRELTRGRSPLEVREAAESMLIARGVMPSALLSEPTERGDAFRALRSLVDAAERLDVTEREIEDRVRELLQSLQ